MAENDNFNLLKAIQGRRIVFERIFHDGSGSPRDPDNFGIGNVSEPNFVIKSPKQVQVYMGIGDRLDTGKFRFVWNTPIDAQPGEDWQIEYGMTISGTYRTQKEKFTVIDVADVEDVGAELHEAEQKDEILFYLENNPEYYVIQIVSNDGYLIDPNELEIVILPENDANPVYSAGRQDLKYLSVGKYEVEIPGLLRGDYVMMYRYRYNSTTRPEMKALKLKIITPLHFSVMPEIRFHIDKAQKSMNKVQGYTDADLLLAMGMSADFFNEHPPKSAFAAEEVMMNWRLCFIYGASIWALKAQYIMEVDLSFDYSGQTISLTYDHKGDISSYIQSLLEEYRTMMDKIKTHIALDSIAGGSIGKRVYGPANTYIFGDHAIDSGGVGQNNTGRTNAASPRSANQITQKTINTNDMYWWHSVYKRSTPSGPQNSANPIGNPRMFPAIKFH
jgi:hypothetical protein